jgi:hypothetical protein
MIDEDLSALYRQLKRMVDIDAPVNIGDFRCCAVELLVIVEEAKIYRDLRNS